MKFWSESNLFFSKRCELPAKLCSGGAQKWQQLHTHRGVDILLLQRVERCCWLAGVYLSASMDEGMKGGGLHVHAYGATSEARGGLVQWWLQPSTPQTSTTHHHRDHIMP